MEKSKKRKGINASDILASIAILVSLLAFVVSIKQLWLQKGQYESQRKENQPIFDIITYRDNVDNGTEILSIKNIGREVLTIDLIQCETFIKLDEWNSQDGQTLYIPVLDYFSSHAGQPGLIGVVITDITEGNRQEYERFRRESETNSLNLRYTCQLINFVKISYTDIYEDSHRAYFENGRKCSKEYYEEIVKKSREVFHDMYFKMGFLTFEDIKEYCVK